MIQAYDLVSWLSTLLLGGLIWVLASKNRWRQPGHLFLVAFFAANMLLIAFFWVLQHQLIALSVYMRYYIWSHFFLLAPLLYLYVSAKCKPGFRWRPSMLWHGSMLPLAILTFSTSYVVRSFASGSPASYWGMTGLLLTIALHLWTALYLVAIFVQLSKYDTAIKQHYSNLTHVNLTWLTALIAVFGVHWLFDVAAFLMYYVNGGHAETQLLLSIFSIGILGIFSLVTVIKSLQRSKVPSQAPTAESPPQSPVMSPEFAQIREALLNGMQQEKPYLNPELTLEELATSFGFSPKAVSRCLNLTLKKNFFDFVNTYRLEEAKRLLAAPREQRKTIAEILYASGFNSKATFNRFFKNHTAMTPTQYRQQAKASQETSQPLEYS